MPSDPGNVSEQALLAEARGLVRTHNVEHVGFIVDGNRRWAAQHHLPSVEGHRRALQVLLDRVRDGAQIGVAVMSFWLFGAENWRRPRVQRDALFALGREVQNQVRDDLTELNARFRHIGRKDRIPTDLARILAALEKDTEANTGIRVIAAIDYGGRDEILRAANAALRAGTTTLQDEDSFARFLDTTETPDPSLVIRTSGEIRTSGFMLWQTAYSEWVFPKVFFPDFGTEAFVAALREFGSRHRRFGG